MASKIYETKQVEMCDCGHDYAAHKKSLRGKLICVYRDPRTDDPCYCDAFTITMKKVRRKVKKMARNKHNKVRKKVTNRSKKTKNPMATSRTRTTATLKPQYGADDSRVNTP